MTDPRAAARDLEPVPTLVVDLVDPTHPLAGARVSIRTAESLCRLLCGLPGSTELQPRLEWLGELGGWLHDPPLAPGGEGGGTRPLNPARLDFLLRVMQLYPLWRTRVAGLLASVVAEAPALRLFAEAGLPIEGFIAETRVRLARRAFPATMRKPDLGGLLERLLSGEADASWLESLDAPMLAELAALLGPCLGAESLRDELAGALSWVAMRTSTLGLASDVRALVRSRVRSSPFVALPVACTALADACRAPLRAHAIGPARSRCLATLLACRAQLRDAHAATEGASLSLDLIYRLGLIEQFLDRVEHLLGVLAPTPDAPAPLAVSRLLASIVRGQQRRRSLRGLLASSTRQLGKRIADCAGHYAEHHLPSTRAEQGKLLWSASGGGFLTAFTTVLKFFIGLASLAPLFEGIFVSLNYAGSFLAMQLCGFSLATKQTSLMAAAMVRTLKRPGAAHEVPAMAARVVQALAVGLVGNVAVVVPSAVLLDTACRLLFGHHLLDVAHADHLLASLHPWKSGTALFAAVTGVLLWLSGIAAGWFQNWASFRRIPDALTLHTGPLGKVIRALGGNPAGTAASVSLGWLMGMVPVLARFCGLGLEVRHVTLATGGLALAGCAVGPHRLLEPGFLFAAAGIAVIAVMNFGVSFALSFMAAVRAQGVVSGLAPRELAREVGRALLRGPQGLLPSNEEPEQDPELSA